MTIADVTAAAQDVVRLLTDYKGYAGGRREMSVDLMVYGYLEGKFGHMSRQHYVKMHSKPKPQRIDFRFGTSNPVVIEFAVRTPKGGGELYGSQNSSELRKLTRVLPSQTRMRVLLLIDLYDTPIQLSQLKPTFDKVHAGKGKFKRHSVRVIYVHRSESYDFRWSPFA